MSDTDPYAAPFVPEKVEANVIGPVSVAKEEPVAVESLVDGTIKEILESVGDDKDKAAVALEQENAKDKPRVSLVDALKAITESE